MGRPPSANPKGKSVPIRLDQETEEILSRYCAKHNTNRAQAIREAIHRLDEAEAGYFWTPEWRQALLDHEQGLKNGAAEVQRTVDELLLMIQEMKSKPESEIDHENKS